MAIIKSISPGKSRKALLNAIDYITREDKTTHALISGLNCNPDTVKEEMICTKNFFGKLDGRQYMHFVQSFPVNEDISPEKANEIALNLASKMFSGYEVLMATHTDREHTHTHFIVNSVGYEDGVKIRLSKHELQHMKNLSDQLCLEHNLSICEKGTSNSEFTTFSTEKYYTLKKANQKLYKSYLLDIAKEVLNAKENSSSREEFIERLKEKGIQTQWSEGRKYIVFLDSKGNKVRNSNIQKTFGTILEKEELLETFEARSSANHIELAAIRVNYLGKENVSLEAECLAISEILRESISSDVLKKQVDQIGKVESRLEEVRQQKEQALKEYENTVLINFVQRWRLKDKVSDLEEKILHEEKQIQTLLGESTKEKILQMAEDTIQLEKDYANKKGQIARNYTEIKKMHRQFGDIQEFRESVKYDGFNEVPARATKEQVKEAKDEVVNRIERLMAGKSDCEENAKDERKMGTKEVQIELGNSHVPLDELLESPKNVTCSKETSSQNYELGR